MTLSEAPSTCSADRLASPIAPFTLEMLPARVCVPWAAICALDEISLVAAPCCSTASAIAVVTWSISRIALAMSLTASTALLVELWIAGDLLGDFFRRLGGLRGEVLHFRCDDREAAAGVSRARRLYRCIEREQVGLRRDRLDQADDGADALAGRGQAFDLGGGAFGGRACGAYRLGRLPHLAGDLLDRA